MRTRPSTSSAISASRTVGRDTFNCSARSRSVGSLLPTAVFAAVDQGAQLIGNLAIKASRFHGFERHARSFPDDP